MKAQEVMRRYAKGDRDFRNVSLRGVNFEGIDLSDIDLSGADIRSTNFRNATLRRANFTRTTSGTQKRWFTLRLFIIALLSVPIGLCQGFASVIAPSLFPGILTNNTNSIETVVTAASLLTGSIFLICFVIFAIAIQLQGFTGKMLKTTALAFLGGFVLSELANQVFSIAGGGIASGNLIGAISLLVPLMLIGVVSFASTIPFLNKTPGLILGSWIGFIAIGTAIGFSRAEGADAGLVTIAGLCVVLFLWVNSYVGQQALKGNPKFTIARTLGLALSTLGSTTFQGADLTEANFSKANLQNARLHPSHQRETTLTHTSWRDATNLNNAKVSGTVLKDARVRSLLTTPESGYRADFTDANLRGTSLNGVTLEGATLRRATLSEAILTNATLKDAILTEAKAAGTNFCGSCMTGAVLDSWQIDSYTQFDQVDCQYIFLTELPDERGQRQRLPKSTDRSFVPNEFKQQIVKYSKQTHRKLLPLEEEQKNIAIKKAEKLELERQATIERQAKEMKDLAFLIAKKPIHIRNENRNKIVTNDQSKHIHVGGNFNIAASNSVVNLGEIGGEVKNQIAHIGQSEPQAQLKELLEQLQAAIEQEKTLNEEEKAEALEEVKELAIAAKDPEDGRLKKAAKRALNTLKGIALGVTTTAALLPAFNKLLPEIAILMGL